MRNILKRMQKKSVSFFLLAKFSIEESGTQLFLRTCFRNAHKTLDNQLGRGKPRHGLGKFFSILEQTIFFAPFLLASRSKGVSEDYKKKQGFTKASYFCGRRKNFVLSFRDHSGYTNLVSEIFDSELIRLLVEIKMLVWRGVNFPEEIWGGSGNWWFPIFFEFLCSVKDFSVCFNMLNYFSPIL